MSTPSTSTNGGRRVSPPLRPHWWVRGLGLSERVTGTGPTETIVNDLVRERLARWRARYSPDDVDGLAGRLAEAGLHESDLVELLAETPASLATRVARPDWAELVESALLANSAPPADPGVCSDWRAAFASALRPLVTAACDRLTGQARRHVASPHLDLPAVAGGFSTWLSRQLVDTAARAFVVELNDRRERGLLTGADGALRFADFVRQLCGPAGLTGIFDRYPVLARLLGQTCRFTVGNQLELLARFAADRGAIVEMLLDGTDPGPVVAMEAGQGDPHQSQRSVTFVTFADGRRVVYRPRPVAAYLRFSRMVCWLNDLVPGLDLRTVAALDRDGYGWLEYIAASPLPDRGGADQFYRRQGALLALLHAVCASDMHYDNLIACGDQPVLVDVETLFHPDIPGPDSPVEPASAALATSVYRTLLLPVMVVGEQGTMDLSGLGGDCAGLSPWPRVDWDFAGTDLMRLARRPGEFIGGRNRPRLGDREVDPGAHETALIEGFRLGYDAIVRSRRGLIEQVEDCAGIDVRIVFRHTRGYQILLDEATHPDLLGDGLDRDRMLEVLRTESAGDPMRSRLCQHEVASLWAGDVPLFSIRAGALDVCAAGGVRLPNLLARSGLRNALDRIAAMSEVDRQEQEWIISATLATRRAPAGHRAEALPGPIGGTAAHPQRLLAAACAIGDQIVARSLADRDRVNWLGLELVDDRQWLVLPMGAGLANGYLGVALFLAQLSTCSGIGRYGEVARRAVVPVAGLLETMAAHRDLMSAVGPGGLHGFGGIAYGLARLAVLLDDAEIGRWTRTAVECAAEVVERSVPAPLGWATGWAGCLAGMIAVRVEAGLAAASSVASGVASRCADRLVAAVDQADGPGFADGAAGVAWALAASGASPEAVRAAAGRAVAAIPAGLPGQQYGWCAGMAGLMAAATRLDDRAAVVLERALADLADRPVLRDLSLCHGELGIADVLAGLDADRFPAAAAVRRQRAGLVLDAFDQYGPGCGTPGGVPTPGLLSGLAGIGYGLLRLGFAAEVPSVLLLEPSVR